MINDEQVQKVFVIFQGILLLKELFNSHPDGKRDYLFYLAIGNARIKEYNKALHYVKAFLEIEPANQQVVALEVRTCSFLL